MGRYEILAKLAAGGMAVVYVARASGVAGFERLVAIKVLHANLAHEEEFIKMFLDEARLAARIRHPNVVPTIDISDSDEAGYFIVMDYIEGDHLGQILAAAHKDNERLPIPVTLRVIFDALGGLGAAHDLTDEAGKRLQLVHRDVSPHNIMVGRDGVARLTDFGVAKAEDRLTHTRDGQVKGKLAYMAPEQAASGQTDSRSDLFSMGVILWESITGRRLFRAESTAATLHKLLHDEVPAPSTVDPALAPLDAVLMKALARDPAQRYQTAEEFATGIEEAATVVGGTASLRAVSKAVKQYAAVKLKRDKKLIDDAVSLLRVTDTDAGGFAIDSWSEPSDPSSSEVSVDSLSPSKVSGVFSHATMPGARVPGPGARGGGPPPVPGAVPPPPLGAVPFTIPEPLELSHRAIESNDDSADGSRGLRAALWIVIALAVCAVGAMLWFVRHGDTENVRVRAIEPPQAASQAPAVLPAASPVPVAQAAVPAAAAPATAEAKVAEPAAPTTAAPKAGPSAVAATATPPATAAPSEASATTDRAATPTPASHPAEAARKPRREAATATVAAPTAASGPKPAEAPKPPPRRVEPGEPFIPNPYQN
ncbi:MAG TPA: serine/threonine-protein kinase [Polyangiales bacterium]